MALRLEYVLFDEYGVIFTSIIPFATDAGVG